MIIDEIDLYLHLNYNNNEVLDINNMKIDLSLKKLNQVKQRF